MAPKQASSLGSGRYISQSALAQVLKELEVNLDSGISRSSIKRGREREVEVPTPYGNVINVVKVSLEPNAGESEPTSVELPFVNPLAWLAHIVGNCEEYGTYFGKLLEQRPHDPQSPFDIIVYSDEVTPGNAMRHCNERKLQCVYWSLKQHDTLLSSERHWFLLGVCRSEIVRRIKGRMSAYIRMCMEQFYTPHDARRGLFVTLASGDRALFFLRISIIVADAAALRDMYDFKGASGTLLCPLCRNVVDVKSTLDSHDEAESILPSTLLDLSQSQPHTDDSIRDVLRFLAAERPRCSRAAFSLKEQLVGFNHNPDGLLGSELLYIPVVSTLMYDWMHLYCVSGIWNVETGLLVERLASSGISQKDLHLELQAFVWPSWISSKSMTGKNIFAKKQTGDISCSASEALSVFQVLRFILCQKHRSNELDGMLPAFRSYMDLCRVLDVLQDLKRGTTPAAVLQDVILRHLRSFQNAYGVDRWRPKHHYTLHLARMYSRHQGLIPCYVHERKHREAKRYATANTNTWLGFEKSIIRDMLRTQLVDLDGKSSEPVEGLVNPSDATFQMEAILRSATGLFGSVKVAKEAMFAPGARCSSGDTVLLKVDGTMHVGKVQVHANVSGRDFSCVEMWRPMGQNMFEPLKGIKVLPLTCIQDACVHTVQGGGRIAVVPSTCWQV